MKSIIVLVLAALLCTVHASTATAKALYAVPLDKSRVLQSVPDLEGVVRYIGTHQALIEGDERLVSGLNARGTPVVALDGPRDGEGLFVVFPGRGEEDPGRLARVLWREPGGAALVSCAEELVPGLRAISFMVYPLPDSMDVRSWFDNTPPAHIRDRTAADELRVRGVVEDAMEAVSSDSLMAHISRLSMYDGGLLKTRFTLREECLTEAKPYIVQKLTEYLPEGADVYVQDFNVRGRTCEQGTEGPIVDYPAENIVGVLPGTGLLPGCYIVCAHYDAIASRSFPDSPFWWCDNPAPGADDNGTGAAAVLESARALSGLSFPFDVRFVLFSGEELGLLGSDVYADSLAGYRAQGGAAAAPRDTVYGVLNVDMVGFKTSSVNPDSCDVVTNPGSRWLANWMVSTADSIYPEAFPGFDVRRVDQALAYSDHAPFWQDDYDGVCAIENWDPVYRNPYYHTTEDTEDKVSPSQLTDVTRMVVGSLVRMAYPSDTVDLALFSDDVQFYTELPNGYRYKTNHVTVGDFLSVRVDFHVFGAEADVDATLDIWDGPAGEGRLLSSKDFNETMGGGEVVTYEFPWNVTDDDVGFHSLSVTLEAPGLEEPISNNQVENVHLRVDAPSLYIAEQFAYPNPARSLSDINIAYRPSRPMEGSGGHVEIKVFDLTGQELGSVMNADNVSERPNPLDSTLRSVSWLSMEGAPSDPPSGIYIYQVSIYDAGDTEAADRKMGKFALVR